MAKRVQEKLFFNTHRFANLVSLKTEFGSVGKKTRLVDKLIVRHRC